MPWQLLCGQLTATGPRNGWQQISYQTVIQGRQAPGAA